MTATTATPVTATIDNGPVYPWDLIPQTVFVAGNVTYYVTAYPRSNAKNVAVVSLNDMKAYKYPIAGIRGLVKASMRKATAEEVAMLEQKEDERIRLGAPVRINEERLARKYNTTTSQVFIVFKDGGKGGLMNMVPLGGDTSGRYLRFPATELTFAEDVAKAFGK